MGNYLIGSFIDPVFLPEDTPREPISDDEVYQVISNETGRERLRDFYNGWRRYQERGEQLTGLMAEFFCYCAIAFGLSGYIAGREMGKKHIERSLALRYETKYKAIRHYSDAMVYGSLSGGMKYALRLAVPVFVILWTEKSLTVYRNKTSIAHYGAAGALAGAIYRVHLGPKGMFAGSVIFGAGCLLYGCCFVPLRYLTNTTQQQYHFKQIRQRLEQDRALTEKLSGPVTKPLVQQFSDVLPQD